MRPENFIYFFTVTGFFFGLVFSVTTGLSAYEIFLSAVAFCIIFYIIGLASCSYFIRYVDLKAGYDINREYKEELLDKFILQLEKRERFIRDSHDFIQNLEHEFEEKRKEELAGRSNA